MEEKKWGWCNQKIQKCFLIIRKQAMIFLKICNTIINKQRKTKKRTKTSKVLLVFDDMITDCNLISQSYFKVLKDIPLNATYYFIMKIRNKRELQ